MNRSFLFLSLGSLLVACPETHTVRYDGGACPVTCAGDTPVCDLSTSTCVGCLTGGDCSGATPICDVETHTCEPCTDSSQCVANGKAPFCGLILGQCVECLVNEHCPSEKPSCDQVSHLCEACGANTDCESPTASRCDLGASMCTPCQGDADCGHLTGTPVCDEVRGTCVQCTGDTEAARCGANSCRRSDGTCTATPRGTVSPCRVCQADSECTDGTACAPVATPSGEFACLPKPISAQCSFTQPTLRPYSTAQSITTLNGAAADVCTPIAATSCAAIRDFGTSCGSDPDCGVDGVSDGVCTTVGGNPNLCSMPCGAEADCPIGRTCTGLPAACH